MRKHVLIHAQKPRNAACTAKRIVQAVMRGKTNTSRSKIQICKFLLHQYTPNTSKYYTQNIFRSCRFSFIANLTRKVIQARFVLKTRLICTKRSSQFFSVLHIKTRRFSRRSTKQEQRKTKAPTSSNSQYFFF